MANPDTTALTDAQVSDSEARLRHAQAIASVGSWELDATTGALTWSDETYRIFGIDPAAFSNSYAAFLAAVHPADRSAIDRAYQEAVANHTAYDFTHRIVRPNGLVRWVQERGETVYDANGKALRTLGIVQDVSERVRRDEAMRAVNQVLSAVFDTTPVLIAYLDTNMNFVRVNAAYAAADRKDPEYFVGKNHFALYPNPENEEIFRHTVESGTPFTATAMPFEYGHNPERGVTHWDWTLTPIKDGDGTVIGLVLSLMNVTERIQVLEELQRKEAELRSANEQLELRVAERTHDLTEANDFNWQILGASLVGVAVYRDSGECVFANEAMAHLIGATPEQVLAQNFRHIASWKQSGMMDAAVATLESGQSHVRDFHVITSFGKEAWFECAFARFSQDGKRHVLLMASDTTARKEAEAALTRQSLRNELILATTLDGFFAADQAGHIRVANPSFCALLGYSQDELLHMTIPDIEANENPLDVAAHIQKVIDSGHDRFDSRHRRKDGSLVDVEVSVNHVDIDGEKMFYAFVRDITPRKEAEAALIRARDEAERANKTKSEFLSRMSHELRTPMNAILGFAQVLELEKLQPEQSEYAHEIYRAGEHLLDLINELLDLSRIEAGKLAVAVRATALQPVVTQALHIVQPLAENKNVAILNHCASPTQVWCDSTRLRQILVNLLGNAVKYNRRGGRVTIECRNLGDDRLRLSVTDTGQGIPPEKLPELFKPFERLGAEFTDIEGTGIGLALSKQLAELMGATLGVESMLGQGSTFWIEIPHAGDQLYPVSAPETGHLATAATGLHAALYVEDNPANLKVVEAMFRSHPNLRLLSATNGEFGIELAKRYRPDVILLDIHLPGMDGYAVLDILKGDPSTRNIPVIALSADAMPIDIERGLEAGFTDYLTKPVKREALMTVMKEVLDRRSSAKAD